MDGWIEDWRLRVAEVKRRKQRIILIVMLLVVLLAGSVGAYSWFRKDVVIQVDGQVLEVATFGKTVEDLLEKEGIRLEAGDLVKPALQTVLRDGLVVKITRAFPVIIQIAGETIEVTTLPAKVAEILEQAGVELYPLDKIEPFLDEQITSPSTITITRVRKETIVQEEEIDYQTVRRQDPTLERGMTKVLKNGRKGLKRIEIEVTYENGKEIGRTVVDQVVVKEPVNRVIAVGTVETVSRGDQNLRFRRALIATATAYTHTGNRTATGVYPKSGTVAVDPRVIPLGSKLFIEGYGFGQAQDTGGDIKGNRIDLFFETRDEALRWGRRKVKVYILE